MCLSNFPASHLISEQGVFEELDFRAEAKTGDVHTLQLEVVRRARFDGLLLWIQLEMQAGEWLDSFAQPTNWLPVYFPVCEPGVEVEPGDRIELACRWQVSDDGRHPNYQVEGQIVRRQGPAHAFRYNSPHHGHGHRQGPFYQALFREDGHPDEQKVEAGVGQRLRTFLGSHYPDTLVPAASVEIVELDHLPRLSDGHIDRHALQAALEL